MFSDVRARKSLHHLSPLLYPLSTVGIVSPTLSPTSASPHCRCEVFRTMFADTSVTDGSPLVLSDMKPLIFMAVLEYVYTNCCSLSTPSVSVSCMWHGVVGVPY